jgi:rubrerythrin
MKKAVEIFKHALEQEVRSGVFYEKAAEVAKDDEARMVFLELSDMEGGHVRRIVERFKDADFEDSFAAEDWLDELERESMDTIQMETDDVVAKGNMRDVLKYALQIEVASQNSYQRLCDAFSDPEDKEFCGMLADEEQGHIKEINRLLQSLDMDEDERPEL